MSNDAVLETLRTLDTDDRAFEESGIAIQSKPHGIVLGASVVVDIQPPRSGLGLYVGNVDAILAVPSNRVTEPPRYYLSEERFGYGDAVVPDAILQYRLAVRVVKCIGEVAAFVDRYQAEAVFFAPSRLRMPIDYKVNDLKNLARKDVEGLESFVFEKMHKDQKAAILSAAIVEACKDKTEPSRFKYLIANLTEIVDKAQEGYKLFASEFSYEKIKGKTEDAINDYTGKIHKTFHDIQNQVMGIPVATVIVATQLKTATGCGVEFWANLAISVGATLFVVLLSIAIANQLMTLSTIRGDLTRQQAKLTTNYSAIADQFSPLYRSLETRVTIHRALLFAILLICVLGVCLTWVIFYHLTTLGTAACI
ncbi:hypothetical protein HNR26_002989 [Rhizobium rosettiformans]|uniref:Uncharacterized protein n=2 Tax=Rhizobium rosettiformans TaxID=1368430 RepID=A0A4V4HQQ8_9HYPH|nr:hypothetical protein [Rhizobium rosettiformans]MBB5276911.1 hypothetical protein [Rhizobium rosettiformans]THV34726.1 hypothetical protein FAA86_13645 [Rhizobium rosettiformans W3]